MPNQKGWRPGTKQTHRSMKPTEGSKMNIYLYGQIILWQRRQGYTMGEMTVSSMTGAGKTGQLQERNQSGLLSQHIQK